MRRRARRNPNSGESTMNAPVVINPGHTIELRPALTRPAPTKPPIRACELLDGMPAHQVSKFQKIAPISAPKITCGSITSAETMPTPTVRATWTPNTRKAMKLKNAAQATAYRGRSIRVETRVAMEFAVSCKPLRKSNASDTMIKPINRGRVSSATMAYVFQS